MTRSKKYIYHFAALFTVTVWGATFVSTKVLLANGLSAAEIFVLRFALAYLCLLPFARRSGADGERNASRVPKKQTTGQSARQPEQAGRRRFSFRDEVLFALAGITGGSLYFLAENMALEYAPASNVSLIVCTAPIWTALLLGAVYRTERMSARRITGSILAFVGAAVVVLDGHFELHLSPRGDLLAFGAALLWMLYSLVIKRLGDRFTSLQITRKIFGYGLATILPWFLVEPFRIAGTTLLRPAVWGNLLFLGLVASMGCYLLWNAAIRHLGAVRTTNYIYLNPLSTIIAAAIFLGERLTPAAAAGAVLILYGMWRAESKAD